MNKSKKILSLCFMALFTFFVVSGNVLAVGDDTTTCGGFEVPDSLINIVSNIVTIIKIGVPIILIVMGMIDLGKAVSSQKDDEIKKGQKTLISRCIAAGIVFFVVAIVQLLFGIVAGGEDESIWKCISSFVNGVEK